PRADRTRYVRALIGARPQPDTCAVPARQGSQHWRQGAGHPTVLREDELGAAYEVPLLDTSYNRDLLEGLRAGAYGSSFRFKVQREDFNQKPARSTYNPKALPERTIREAKVMEFGPVTFPAYEGATAGVRSLTDWWLEPA